MSVFFYINNLERVVKYSNFIGANSNVCDKKLSRYFDQLARLTKECTILSFRNGNEVC